MQSVRCGLTLEWKSIFLRIRNFSKLRKLKSFKERYDYLKLGGEVGIATFGADRYLNQAFYRSKEWKRVRDQVIVRDNGCDLGVEGYQIYDRIYIHHMNPMTVDDVLDRNEDILNPEFLICVSFDTHNAIHFGDASLLPKLPIERKPGDTTLW